jgi:hypothetical protein
MPEAQPARRYRWVWFFVVLGVLTTGGVAANVWFNLRQQLTSQQLADAHRLWKQKKPGIYDLHYTVKREVNPDLAGTVPQNYTAHINGKEVLVTSAGGHPLKTGDYDFDTMDSLFDAIDRQLYSDADPGRPRAFVKATFDGSDGHVKHYVHSIMRTRERLEVTVEMTIPD